MAIVSIHRLSTSETPKGGKGGHVHKNRYRVITDDKDDSQSSVKVWGSRSYRAAQGFSDGLPEGGDYWEWGTPGTAHYSTDFDAFALWPPEIVPEYQDQTARRLWIATVTFETAEDATSKPDQQENPLAEPWEFSSDADEWTEEATKDEDGIPITNSSLEQFKGKLVQVYKSRARYHLARNFAYFSSALMDDLRMSVNATSVVLDGNVYGPRCCQIRRIRKQRRVYGGDGKGNYRSYDRVELEIDTNPETFDLQLVDMGYRELIGKDPKDPKSFAWIKDAVTKQNTPTPMLLDGKGKILKAGNQAVIIRRRYYKRRVWTFNFP